MGIVNGTTNYMLTSMSEEGCDYAVALAQAQELGYAEPDPTADVEGLDARSKAAILAGIAFDVDVVASDVHTEGITAIGASDIAFAQKLGYVIKLLAVAERVNDGPTPAVAVRVPTRPWFPVSILWRACGGRSTPSSWKARPPGS